MKKFGLKLKTVLKLEVNIGKDQTLGGSDNRI